MRAEMVDGRLGMRMALPLAAGSRNFPVDIDRVKANIFYEEIVEHPIRYCAVSKSEFPQRICTEVSRLYRESQRCTEKISSVAGSVSVVHFKFQHQKSLL